MNTRIVELLKAELAKRKKRNIRYSVRAFARDLGVSQTSVSYILHGRRKPSVEILSKILVSLKIPNCQHAILLKELGDEFKYIKLDQAENQQLTESWHYFAILSLAELTGFALSPYSISKQLGITNEDAKRALNFLIKKEFLLKEERQVVPSGYRFNIGDHKSVRKIHESFLEKAKSELYRLDDPVTYGNSDYSEVFMAINSDDISWAKAEIKKFRRSLIRKLEQKESKNCVFALGIQLLPLSRLK